MTIEQRKKLLLTFKLSTTDFYDLKDQNGDVIIIKRTGIDKLVHQSSMRFNIESIQTVPYGTGVCTTILASGTIDNVTARTTASANPDNCSYPNYAEVAEKRVRHRLLLQLLHLYEHGIFSEAESDKFIESRNRYLGAVNDVKTKLNLT